MILSVGFYLIVFFTVLLLFFLSEHLSSNDKKYSGIFSLIGIIILCLIAGLRGENVGVDVKVYIVNYCEIAKNYSSIIDILNNHIFNIGIEYIFGILLYFCTRFTFSAQILLFLLQFLTVYPIYKSAKIVKNKYPEFSITLSMMTYLFLYFNNSLNMMRQSVAIAFLLLGTVELIINNNKKNMIISYIIALFSHKFSIFGIILIFVIHFLSNNKKNYKKFVMASMEIGIILLPLFLNALYRLIVKLGLSNSSLDYYSEIFLFNRIEKNWFVNPFSKYSLSFIVFIVIFSIFLILLSRTRKNSNQDIEKNKNEKIFSNFVLYGYLIYLTILFSYKTMYGIRISIMLDMFNIIALPLCISSNTKYKFLYCTVLIINWVWLIIGLGWSGSNIYSFFL